MLVMTGILIYFFLRCILYGFFTIDQNERGVKTVFGRAQRLGDNMSTSSPFADSLNVEEKKRYNFPLIHSIGPGLHFKFPWEKVIKVSVATETMNMAHDLESAAANNNGTLLEAVTKDQLNIGLKGQIRYRISEQNLYAFVFGIKNPIVHVMGYFVSVLRQRIATFGTEDKEVQVSGEVNVTENVSINDLRKNLKDINDIMVSECQSSNARYGIILEASLITGIEPPHEVESALAAINTAHNNVSSEISLAKSLADQTIVQSRRAVEIETLKAQAEVQPLIALSHQLRQLKASGPDVLRNFVRNARLSVLKKADKIIYQTE
ncbi:MAG: SPFH domain-containing protein [Bdellovibrionales bacterium]|nr:SPFH domain-containing protein [Bdellovibrionales bacterium]MBL7670945.1 SPFH domain-containing protein [Pseudobdellovibrionaceae bacterium]